MYFERVPRGRAAVSKSATARAMPLPVRLPHETLQLADSRPPPHRRGKPTDAQGVFYLQRTVGNAATTALLRGNRSAVIQRELAVLNSDNGPYVRKALAGLITSKKIAVSDDGSLSVFAPGPAVTRDEVATALYTVNWPAGQLADAIMNRGAVTLYHNGQFKDLGEGFAQAGKEHVFAGGSILKGRRLNNLEAAAARRVFGSALDLDRVLITEDVVISMGDTARTLPGLISFPPGSFTRADFLPWLIHELTHIYQYQRGASIPGMLIDAARGNYDYGGEAGLKKALQDGKEFSDFNYEQQGDIMQHYHERMTAGQDVSAWEPFVDNVRYPNKKWVPVPLPEATLDLAPGREKHRKETEAKLIEQLELRIRADDVPAMAARKRKVIELFRDLTWFSQQYRERIEARRADDKLVTLLFTRMSRQTRAQVLKILGG
jgi:hypothetical protein